MFFKDKSLEDRWVTLRDIWGARIISEQPKHLLAYSVNLASSTCIPYMQIARTISRVTRFKNYKKAQESDIGKNYVYRKIPSTVRDRLYRHTPHGRDLKLKRECKKRNIRFAL